MNSMALPPYNSRALPPYTPHPWGLFSSSLIPKSHYSAGAYRPWFEVVHWSHSPSLLLRSK